MGTVKDNIKKEASFVDTKTSRKPPLAAKKKNFVKKKNFLFGWVLIGSIKREKA